MKFIVYLLAAMLLSQMLFAQTRCYLSDPEAGMRPRNVDFQHLKLEITLLPEKGLIKGIAEHTFIPLQEKTDSIFLDAPSITVHKVSLNGKTTIFETSNNGIIIRFNPALTWGNTHRINIEYEATPRKGLYFIGWNQQEPQRKTLQSVRKQIWTQGQGIDNRHWIPMFDDMSDKITSEVMVSFDKNYRVLSNGTLITSKEKKDGTRLWHYKMTSPHAPYLIMLAIGNYEVRTTKTKNGVVVNNWYYPEFPETVGPTFRYTEQMIDWMEQEFGVAYPWEQYSQVPVQNFMYGAMENTTATIFGDFYLVDPRAFLDRNYISTNAHELVHQWFGNYVTAWSAEDVWLQESFATHYQKHFERSIFGNDHFHWNRRNELNTVLAASKENNNPIRHTKAGTARIYPKGSLVLDMLRYILGDTQYQKAITHYLKKYPYQNVNTDNFKMAFYESLGVNLDWFFEQWIYRGGEPHYKVEYADIIKNGKRYTEFQVIQAHEQNDLTGLFRMPIVFRVHYKDGSTDEKKEWIVNQHHTVVIPNDHNKEIDFVLFDPNSWLIKNVTFKKSFDALKSQAARAPDMIDRYDALLALESEPYLLKKDFLISLYKNEPFYGCRAEIVKQLVSEPDSLDSSVISLFVHDIHPRVRQSAVEHIPAIPQSFITLFEKLLTDSSYLVVEKTLEKLSSQYPARLENYLEITKNDIGTGSALRIKWLELASALNKQYLNELIARSGKSYEFRTRVNAFEALKRLNYMDETVALNLLDAIAHFNNRLSGPAKKIASYFKEQNEYKTILSETYKSQNWEEWQDDLLQSFLK